ncbi:hypothetical protein [Burkholderia cenocepacia]|uniref:hypothetical protein n=1 Tax=Burkholderia cenocepacia TaxID=95486 RepID=UPI0013DEBDFC|nr:hypothetical protein [Burkholderia cenocepacia]MCW3587424.1 hypothetical protein [Burkholderia cenocepacia]MCW3633880.1 hypothetical protein [Burkholderia cenocepacia]MCW5184782.1 hypothetical protein [Burkholderia cenocepacia]NGO98012.1 hypothetical protein [Burkholderia cenocepacia]
MNKQFKAAGAVLAVSSVYFLGGCSKPVGEEFIGSWQSPAHQTEHIEIERSGDSFTIRDIGPTIVNGKPRETKLPAIYKDGVLQVATGMGAATFGHDAKNDTLIVPTLGGSLDFSRIKK